MMKGIIIKRVIFVILMIVSFGSLISMMDEIDILGKADLSYVFASIVPAGIGIFVSLGKNVKVILLTTIISLMSIAVYMHFELKVEWVMIVCIYYFFYLFPKK